MKKLSPTQVSEVCHRYQAGESGEALAKEFSVHGSSLRGLLERRGIARRSYSERNRRYTCNHDFFSKVDSEMQAYWLGFIAADGGVDARNRFSFTIASKDRAHLENFALIIESNHQIKDRRYNGHAIAHFGINSEKLAQDLARYGVIPNKTFTLQWPILPQELLRHFLRGYFDGDGCIKINPHKPSNVEWSLTGNEHFLRECQNYLIEACQLSKTKLTRRHPETPIADLRYSGCRQVQRIRELLYGGASIYLARKHKQMFSI